jgi:hypothetical protein
MSIRNNREYDSITKEVEYQNLDIQLSEKRIKEFTFGLETKMAQIEKLQETLAEKTSNLESKKSELAEIINETDKKNKIYRLVLKKHLERLMKDY